MLEAIIYYTVNGFGPLGFTDGFALGSASGLVLAACVGAFLDGLPDA